MDQRLVADIVRRALAPEPVSADGQPRETPLDERLRLLNNALGSTQLKVQAQQDQLAELKRRIEEYRALVNGMKDRAVETERLARLVEPSRPPEPQAPPPPPPTYVPVSAAPAPSAALPVFVPQPAARVARPAPARHPWMGFAPYAALAAVGLALSLGARKAPEIPPLTVAVRPPAPAIPKSAEVSDADILSMVYAHVPPGESRTVEEILGPELEATAAELPWMIVRVDEKTALVSFRPYADVLESGPVYEFSVDPATRMVLASPETVTNLRGGLAAAR